MGFNFSDSGLCYALKELSVGPVVPRAGEHPMVARNEWRLATSSTVWTTIGEENTSPYVQTLRSGEPVYPDGSFGDWASSWGSRRRCADFVRPLSERFGTFGWEHNP
jgi:hypothetical protein